MPQYEFNNKETGEPAGELFLSLEGLEDFLKMNPNLCVAPGKLRYLKFKSDEGFPSYPDIDHETRCQEEKTANWKPAQPASWNDTKDPLENYTKYKVTDKRKNKISHFDEDIKKYGKIVGTPRMMGDSDHDFEWKKIDSSEPLNIQEEDQMNAMQESKDRQGTYERDRLRQKGWTSQEAINLGLDSQELMPWESGFTDANKDKYADLKKEMKADQERINRDKKREWEITHKDDAQD